ncbi:SusC/RagA family TonB-linked outer membrane protein [Rudanella paleaurantiibacter]|uniref:SusC/RagA family TonB-linked outer membrane protein n=1 Tax=Rudanella paleaurantiibacter TaxID=2614655 RepID=A0A7J5TU18_9BACT|nr:SusC/RagA family TonB-linked outer membrane protein [Rudanella paleaurantiibacter]KAB7727361.1 SusC/RagA family TonB-linked outer membrane protein [Rudanella paleaurantiibacter]
MIKRLSTVVLLGFIAGGQPGTAQVLAKAPQATGRSAFQADREARQQLALVLGALKDRYKVDILFFDRMVEGQTVSSDQVNYNLPLEENLKRILKPAGLDYKKSRSGAYVIIGRRASAKETSQLNPSGSGLPESPLTTPAQAEPVGETPRPTLARTEAAERPLTGTVVDEKGESLPGVSVTVKGTQRGTTTDAKGLYRLSIPETGETVLVFSYVGYVTQERVVGNQSTVDITMQADTRALEEVVVVGYGTQKKSDLTGSVVAIGKERLTQLPNTNIAQALQGSIPGLQINNNDGGAEQNDVSIIVRGRSSISASNAPLIILDGVPYTGGISDINPTDIASIDVLKDASAAAIYGSRGSNGVIIVTTKQGSKGKLSINYDGFYGTQTIANRPDLLTGAEFYAFKKGRANAPNTSMTPSEEAVFQSGQFADWYALATRPGWRSQHSLAVSGGNDKATFYIGGTYLNVGGIAKNDDYRRYTLRPNFDVRVTPWLTFSSNSQLSFQDRSGLPADFSGQQGANFMNPLTTPFNPDGTLTVYAWPEYNLAANPLAPTLARNINNVYRIFTTNSLKVDLPFVPGLSYKINTGVEFQTDVRRTYYGRNTRTGFENKGQATNFNGQQRNFTVENILTYSRTFGNHSVNLTGLYSSQSADEEQQQVVGVGFPNDVLTNFQMNTATLLTPTSSYSKQNLESQMLRLNYSYDGRYLLTLTARRDGYSGFGAGRKYGTFPSVAVGWNLAREPFMSNVPFLTNLKLRASYGLNGNQAVSPYQALATLATRSYITTSGAVLPGYVPSRLANEELGWESTRSLNLGLDFGMLGNRIQGSIDVYQKNTQDLLLNRIISSVQGFNRIIQNIGKTANKGIELAVTSTNLNRNGFTWTTNTNGSYNINRIVDLYGDGRDDQANGWFIGKPVRTIFDLQYDGIFRSPDEVAASPQKTALPGYVRIKDANNDGKIDAADRTFQGNQDPLYLYGLTNTFSYKGFSLMVFVQGVASIVKENPLVQDAVFIDVRRNTTRKDWWTPQNPNAGHWANDANANLLNINIYEDASFARLKDISLAYQLPATLVRRLKMNNLRFYVSGRNLATFTRYEGLDPEISNQLDIPLQREILFGINLSL